VIYKLVEGTLLINSSALSMLIKPDFLNNSINPSVPKTFRQQILSALLSDGETVVD